MDAAKELATLISEIRETLAVFDAVTAPELKRPGVDHGQPPTEDLIKWTLRVYAYSLLCQFREILRSTVHLYDQGHVPAVFLCCRSLFEMAAHSYYVHKHALAHLKATDLKAAWDLMLEVNQGSRYMREKQEAGKLPAGSPPLGEGPHIAKVVKTFNEYFRERGDNVARENYSFLSEFCHPNSFAFSNHLDFTDENACATVTFCKPSPEICIQVIPDALFSCMPLLLSLRDLLTCAGDAGLDDAMRNFLRIVKPENTQKLVEDGTSAGSSRSA